MRFSHKITVAYFLLQALLTLCIEGVFADEVPKVKPEKDDLDGLDFLSEWSGWSQCSRTCGTGIQFRGRRCNRDRSPCLRFPRQHRICNNQLCPVNSPDFRDVQCAREDDSGLTFEGKKAKWKSIERGTSGCALFCHPIGQRLSYYLGRVVDGTKCIDEPYSVCVAGQCTSVGCDRVLGSKKVFDRCKVCGGNGSTCEPYSGMIEREPRAEEKKEGYLKLFIIPEGATTILISEVSQNYLAIKRASGAFVFGGDKKMSDPGTYRVNTTDFQYSKLPSENSEALMIMGPTKEEFHVMAILTNKDNPKADYEYWIPKNRPTTPPKPVFKVHTQSTNTKRRVTSKATPRKTIFDESNFLKGRKTEIFLPSTERPLLHTQPMTTEGNLVESSPSTPEQHISKEYPATTESTLSPPNTQPMTTEGDLVESSPSTPEQHISTEYPATTASTDSSQPMTTTGDLVESSPSTPEQHISTDYLAATTASTDSSQPMTTGGDLDESLPSTPEQHISTDYLAATTASTLSSPYTQPMTTAGDLVESSPSTPEQHISTEYPATTASTLSPPNTQPMTTAGDLVESSPSTPEQHISTEYSVLSTASSTGVVLNGHHQDTNKSQTSTTPSGQPITPELNDRTISTEYPMMTQQDGTTTTTEHPSTKQVLPSTNLTTTATENQNTTTQPTATENQNATTQPIATEMESTEMPKLSITPEQNEYSVTDPSTFASPTSTEASVTTKQFTTTHLPVSDDSSATRFQPSQGTLSTMEHPTTTHVPTNITTPTTQNRTTTQRATEKNLITEEIVVKDGENISTRQPPITVMSDNTTQYSTTQPTATENQNATAQPTATENQNTTTQLTATEEQNATAQPTATEIQRDATAQPTATENQNTTAQPTATENQNVTAQPTATEIQNATAQPTAIANQNATTQLTAIESQNATIQPTATQNQNTTAQSTATENQNTTAQPTATQNQNATTQLTAIESQNATVQPTTIENQNTTAQPTATENQNATARPTATENQNVTTQPIATENQNATAQPTATENQNATAQPTATEIQNATAQPSAKANQNATTQPTATQIQNPTAQPTATQIQNATAQPSATEIQNATSQPTATQIQNPTAQPSATEIQNATSQPTATQIQNATIQPTATENQNTTTQPTTIENQNATAQPTATQIQNATAQPTATEIQNATAQPTATEIQNATAQPTATEIQNATAQPTATEIQNATAQPTATEIQNATTQPTATEIQNATAQPTATENLNATKQPTATENQNATTQPTATEIQNATTQPTATENQNATKQPTATENQNATTQPTATENQNATTQPTATEIQNATAQPTTNATMAITLADVTTSEQPTTTMEPKADKQFIDSGNYSLTGLPTTKERLTTDNGTNLPATARETNNTISPTLEGTNTIDNHTSDYMPWSRWTPCSRSCGLGFKVRARLCIKSNESTCYRNETQITLCTIRKCEKIPMWSPWKPWSECSSQCGIGLRIRVRTCRNSKSMTLMRTSCPGRRYEIEICRSSANCSRVDLVKPSSMYNTVAKSSMETPSMSSCQGKLCQTPSFTSSATSKASLSHTRTAASESVSHMVLPVTTKMFSPMSIEGFSSERRKDDEMVTRVMASSTPVDVFIGITPSASKPSSFMASSAARTTSLPSSTSSIMLQPVSAASKSSSEHPLPTRTYQMTSLEPSLSTTAMSTSSSSMVDTTKTPSVPKPSTSRSPGGSFEAVTKSKVHTSVVASIEPTRTSILPRQESSKNVVQVQSGSCSRCRTSRKKQKLFCTGDYAIHVQVKNGSLTSNKKTLYHLLVQNIYNSKLPLPKELFIRVTGIQCPCPRLQTGKEYLVIGRTRRTKKGYSKILINRRSFVEEWSGSFNSEVELLRNRCIALGFNMSSSFLKTVDLKSRNSEKNNSVAEGTSVIPTTGKPGSTISTTATIINKYSDCSPCVPSVNSSIGALYCTSEYAIRARVNKYRKATNRTMFYAHVITTYKTTIEMPIEALLRVPGEKCPCPRLVPGVEYLMIGKTKKTLNGKTRLTLNVESFYAAWRDEFEKEINTTKTRCGLPVVTSQLNDKSTTAPHDESTTALAPTVNPTRPTTPRNNTSCPSCDQSTINENQQKRFCKNKNVFRGRVAKSFSTSTNRTLYYISIVTSFKSNFEMPDSILARLSDNSCQCSHLTVGKEYLIMGQVKMNKKGNARVVLTKKSFLQDWNPGLIEKIDQLKTKCGLPVVNNGSGPSTEPSGKLLGVSITPRKAVEPTTVPNVTRKDMCPPCRVSANIHDYCSNDYVFRGRVLKGYRTSANRTVYHVSVSTSYKSLANLSSVVLVRVPGVSCPCPQLQVGVDYVFMGWVRVKRKSISRMTLRPENFAQKWDEGFEVELSSIRSSCKKSSVIDGPLVQSFAVNKDKISPTTSGMPKLSTTATTQALLPTASLNLTSTTGKRCKPCQTSKKRNRLYCTSDYVVTVEIEKKEYNPVTHNTKYYAAIKYTFKERDPQKLMIILWVLNNECNCPDLQLDHTYVVMVNSDFGENGVERLMMSERSFVKEWTKGLHRRILKLKNTCNTDHKRRY